MLSAAAKATLASLRRSRCGAEAVRSGPRHARRCSWSHRAGSRRGRSRFGFPRRRVSRRSARPGRRAARRVARSTAGARARAAPGAHGRPQRAGEGEDRSEPVVGQACRAPVRASSGSPAARAAGPTAPSLVGVVSSDDADVGEAVLEGGVEEELAPARSAPRRGWPRALPRLPDAVGVDGEGAAADLDRAEEEAVPGEVRVEALARAR